MRDVALVRELVGIPVWGVVGTLISKDRVRCPEGTDGDDGDDREAGEPPCFS